MARRSKASIEVKGIHQSYGEMKVLKDVTFKVSPGEFVGVIGHNGSGKTTLLGCMTGAVAIDKGRVRLGGRSIDRMTSLEIAQIVGIVPQQTSINFEFTVEEVILMGRYPHVDRFRFEDQHDYEVAEEAMRSTDTYKIRERLVTNLSGGEKQRVIIARALSQEPKVMLLDEPTAHLDIRHQLEVLGLIRGLNEKKGLTVFAVFHDLDLASRYCDRLLLMKDGGIMADGSPEEVLVPEALEKGFGVKAVVKRSEAGHVIIEVGELAKGVPHQR